MLTKIISAAYGVDDVMGSFVAITTQYLQLSVDNKGVSLLSADDSSFVDLRLYLTYEQRQFIDSVHLWFKISKQVGAPYPNISAQTIHDAFNVFGIEVPKATIQTNLEVIGKINII